MFGTATLEIPQVGDIGPLRTEGLSEELAMVIGMTAAWTLSEQNGFVIVTLSDGTARTIGHDTVRGELTFGRLGRPTIIRSVDLAEGKSDMFKHYDKEFDGAEVARWVRGAIKVVILIAVGFVIGVVITIFGM